MARRRRSPRPSMHGTQRNMVGNFRVHGREPWGLDKTYHAKALDTHQRLFRSVKPWYYGTHTLNTSHNLLRGKRSYRYFNVNRVGRVTGKARQKYVLDWKTGGSPHLRRKNSSRMFQARLRGQVVRGTTYRSLAKQYRQAGVRVSNNSGLGLPFDQSYIKRRTAKQSAASRRNLAKARHHRKR